MNRISQNCTKLTPNQLQAIAVLSAIPSDFKTMEEAAQKAGVCRRTLYNWFELPEFSKKLKEEADNSFTRFAGLVRSAHLRGIIENCNPALIRLYYEKIEGWQNAERHNINLTGERIVLNLPPSPFTDGTLWKIEQEKARKTKLQHAAAH